jgi:hypothetical protein
MNIFLMEQLGEFNMAPNSPNLLDLGSKPVHTYPYTVPRSAEQPLQKELQDWWTYSSSVIFTCISGVLVSKKVLFRF